MANNILSNINLYGPTEDFDKIQTIDISDGRYLTEADFERGTPVCVIGNKVATELYGSPERALGKSIGYNGRKLLIEGIVKKQGQSLVGGFDFDQSVIVPYRYELWVG